MGGPGSTVWASYNKEREAMKKVKQLTFQREYDKLSTKTFRLPVEFVETLDKLAKSHNTSMNKVVIQCLEFALNNIDESEME